MNKRNIVIDLIMADVCNRTCDYCPLKFSWKILNKQNIDFIIEYLSKNSSSYDECTINFFWWEPLINFEWIKYFVGQNKNSKITYSIGTNGVMLTEEILDFLIEYDIRIYLTFHADSEKTYKQLLKKEFFIKALDLIQINFIVSPIDTELAYNKIDEVVNFWFKVVNIIPVMLTMKWDRQWLVRLNKFINYVDHNYTTNDDYSDLKIYKFSYFDGIPVEIGFVIGVNLDIYQDSSDELFIWKQYDKLWEELIAKVEKETLLWNLKDYDNFLDIINKYDVAKVVQLLRDFPKKMWYITDYALVYRIMNGKENNRSNMGWNIYDISIKKK